MDSKQGVVVKGLSQHDVHSAEDVLKQLQTAQTQRMVGETKMNKQSSRSHCLFTINIKAKVQYPDGTMEVNGKLHLVDLAGSECAKTASLDKADKATAARERERMNINRSLLTLGRVISCLKEISENKVRWPATATYRLRTITNKPPPPPLISEIQLQYPCPLP